MRVISCDCKIYQYDEAIGTDGDDALNALGITIADELPPRSQSKQCWGCPGTACYPFNHQPNNGRTLPLRGNNQGSTSPTIKYRD